jgi:hypothetical protein
MADIGDKGLTACDEMSEFGSKSSTKEEKQPMAGKITALDLAPAELSEATKLFRQMRGEARSRSQRAFGLRFR